MMSNGNKNVNAYETNTTARLYWLFFSLRGLPIVGTALIIVVTLNFLDRHIGLGGDYAWRHIVTHFINILLPYLTTIGFGLLIGGAAYVGGGFCGFLFGLPRYLSNPDSPLKNFSRNDNLIQISDWLTKIIVGLGLTNLYKIPHIIKLMGGHLSVVLNGKPGIVSMGSVTAECIVIYFLISGFLMGYLWTNIQYIPILTQIDEETKNLTAQKQAQETIANAAIDAHTDSLNALDNNTFSQVTQRQKDSPKLTKILSFTDFTALVDKAKQNFQKGLQAQSSIPDNLKDPNKNQWGGKSESNDRRLIASVITMLNSDLFRVTVTLISTNENNPMTDGNIVVFALHNTFVNPFKVVTIKDGKAVLEFISYGAFTIGVLCDDGITELEYDLTTIPNAPDKFIKS